MFAITHILIFLFAASLPLTASATTATVHIDTRGEDINAIEGTLVLPDTVEVEEIHTGNSVILFWVRPPQLIDNTVSFAGIAPGGFTGGHALFTIHGNWNADALANIERKEIEALKNDGLATQTQVEITITPSNETEIDREPPEAFTVEITRNPDFFEHAWFAVFATQDKTSGIDRYEVCEGYVCEIAESPYRLRNQNRTDTITVRAIDHSDNMREATVPGASSNWIPVLIGIVAAIVTVVFVLRKKILKLWH